MQLQPTEPDLDHITVQARCRTIFREDGHLFWLGLSLPHYFDQLTPTCFLTVIDLPQIQYLPLNNPLPLGTSVFHDTPVAVFFAVFKAGLGAQK
jgi:hypothetical protein